MKTSKFNFKRHQSFSKSWKMLIRFLVYSVVITFLIYLIYGTGEEENKSTDSRGIEQIDIDIDEIEME